MGRVKPSGLSKAIAPVRNYFAVQAAKAAWLWLSPIFGGVAGIVAWLEGLSPTAVLQTVLVAGAMVAVLLNQGRSYLSASSPRGKVALSIATEQRINTETQETVGYMLTAYFTNSADFSVEIEVLDFGVTIQGHTIDHMRPKDQIWMIDPKTTFFLDYGLIPYVPPEAFGNPPVQGTMRLSYDYGRKGKPGFKEVHLYRIIIYLDDYGGVLRTDRYRIRDEE